ncbi:MAG: flagellar hook-basal body complex protein [Candidatus Margulisiibacteriota bacterium]
MTDRIFEIGRAGLESSDQRVRKLMDNMVNSEVPGYKKSEAVVRGFPLELQAAQQRISSMKPQVEGTFYNHIQGALIKTDGKLDVAMGSDGYFVFAGPWGEGYTRDGRFRLDKEGRLLTVSENFPVLGNSGPIIVPQGSEIEISQSGQILVDGVEIDRMQVVKPELKDSLESLNGTFFKKKDPYTVMVEIENPRIIQGYIEASNVNIIEQMMEMINLERTTTINTKIIQTRDANLARAMELGRATQ